MVDSTTSPMVRQPYITLLEETCSKYQNEPLSKLEEKVHTSLVRRKLYNNPQQTIVCKTRGQPILLKRLVNPRKESQSVKTPTKRKRAKIIRSVSKDIAGTSNTSTSTQQISELKVLPIKTRQELCEKAGIAGKGSMTIETSLAMKEVVGLIQVAPSLQSYIPPTKYRRKDKQ